MQKAKVKMNCTSSCSTPLIVKAGEIVEGQEKESPWLGWLWCRNATGTSSWVPKNYLKPVVAKPGYYQFLRDYNAKELTVQTGEKLLILFEESDWAWVRRQNKEEGWVPLENLKIIKS